MKTLTNRDAESIHGGAGPAYEGFVTAAAYVIGDAVFGPAGGCLMAGVIMKGLEDPSVYANGAALAFQQPYLL